MAKIQNDFERSEILDIQYLHTEYPINEPEFNKLLTVLDRKKQRPLPNTRILHK